MTTTTQEAVAWWGHRGGAMDQREWVERYWDSWTAPHRQNILVALDLLHPVQSLFEIGCNGGPNLRLIRSRAPTIMLSGQDLCKVAADWAEAHLGIPISTGALPDCLEALPSQSVDVVLSCYTLAYLDERDVQTALLHLVRMARKAIVLLEPLPIGTLSPGPCRFDGLPEWRHDYDALLPWRVACKWPIEPVQNLNGFVVYTRKES